MVTDAAYYAGILEAVYDHLAALDTTGYQWGTGERWAQSPSPELTDHLQCWVDLGSVESVDATSLMHALRIQAVCRYAPDDDSISQARTHAAARAAIDALTAWRTHELRCVPRGYTIEAATPDHLSVTITATLILPRGV